MADMHGGENDLGPLAQIPLGEGRNFSVGGITVAVFRTHAGEVFATQPNCPHRQGPLADGLMGGATIVCPLHDRVYDLRSGAALNGECGLTTYPVRLSAASSMILTLPPPQ